MKYLNCELEEDNNNINNKIQKIKKKIKHDYQFQKKCGIYNLPCYLQNISDSRYDSKINNKINRNYKNVKNKLIHNNITLDNIMMIDGISDNIRTKLVEQYSILQQTDDIQYHIKLRNKLQKIINNLTKQSKNDELSDDLSDNNHDNMTFRQNIKSIQLDQQFKKILMYKYKELQKLDQNDNIYHKLKQYLNIVSQIPFGKKYDYFNNDLDKFDIFNNIMKQLNNEIYGLQHIKQELLIYLNDKYNKIEYNNNILALEGPPGVGKTNFVRIMAQNLKIPFEQISLGGFNDVSQLIGHSYTYEGSKPGKIVEALIKMKCNNGIIFFDEIDKIDEKGKGQEVINLLLHIIDFTQNNMFYDNYISEIPIDLSNIWFIFSMNDQHNVNYILKNRLKIIKIQEYSKQDKFNIIKNYLIPKLNDHYKINDYIIIHDEIIKYIIQYTDNEPGIRTLKFNIENIFKTLRYIIDMNNNNNLIQIKIQINQYPYILKENDVRQMIQPRQNNIPYGLYI